MNTPLDFDLVEQLWQLNQAQIEDDEFLSSPKSHPFYRVLQTLTMIAEVKAFKLQTDEAVKIYEFVKSSMIKVYGTDQNMQVSNLDQLIAEAYIKQSNERTSKPLAKAVDHAKRSISLVEKIIGTKAGADGEVKDNYLLAQRLQTLGDVYREMEDEEECEKTFLRGQIMIGNMFGDRHPCIMAFNTNLVTCYSMNTKLKEAKKGIMSQIMEKNFEIAKATYGIESIHLLYHLSCYLINKIAIGEVMTPN